MGTYLQQWTELRGQSAEAEGGRASDDQSSVGSSVDPREGLSGRDLGSRSGEDASRSRVDSLFPNERREEQGVTEKGVHESGE